MKIPISCLVVIHSYDKVLLLERQDRPGFWQSVTGSMEVGETLRETACRELLEETGLGVVEGVLQDYWWANQYRIDPYWQARYASDVHWNTEHVFGFRVEGCPTPHLSPQEHTQFAWLSWDQAVVRAFSPSNQRAIEWIRHVEEVLD